MVGTPRATLGRILLLATLASLAGCATTAEDDAESSEGASSRADDPDYDLPVNEGMLWATLRPKARIEIPPNASEVKLDAVGGVSCTIHMRATSDAARWIDPEDSVKVSRAQSSKLFGLKTTSYRLSLVDANRDGTLPESDHWLSCGFTDLQRMLTDTPVSGDIAKALAGSYVVQRMQLPRACSAGACRGIEPDNRREEATDLGEADDNLRRTLITRWSTLVKDDVEDWFKVSVKDEGTFNGNPRIEAASSDPSLDVTIFFACASGAKLYPVCPNEADTSIGSGALLGCRGAGSATLKTQCESTITEDGTAYVVVRRRGSGAAEEKPYRLAIKVM
jgi:hypothetical protein